MNLLHYLSIYLFIYFYFFIDKPENILARNSKIIIQFIGRVTSLGSLMSVCWLVGWSVIISSQGNLHAPIGARLPQGHCWSLFVLTFFFAITDQFPHSPRLHGLHPLMFCLYKGEVKL